MLQIINFFCKTSNKKSLGVLIKYEHACVNFCLKGKKDASTTSTKPAINSDTA